MANASAPLEFTEGERQTVNKLAVTMQVVAAVLLLLAGINVVGGIIRLLLGGSAAGILAIVEGVTSGLLALVMLASAASVRFIGNTKFGLIHLGKAFQNLTIFYKALLLLLIPILALRLLLG